MPVRRSSRIARVLLYAVPVLLLGIAVVLGSAYFHNATSDDDMIMEKSVLHPAQWPSTSVTIANLGHATLLMNYLGVRVISDPTLFERVGLAFDSLFTVGPHRLVSPPLTHAHMDHLDLPSLKALPKTAVVIACTGCAELIRPLGFADVRELRWGDSTEVDGLTVTAMGARHWGKRWPWGRDYGFNSYVLEKKGVRMLLACDSASTDIFAKLQQNPPEIAAFSIGAYDPWIRNHANPEQVWAMFKQTGAHYLVPIHWGTFKLSKEPREEPMQRLIAAAGDQADDIVLRSIGGVWTAPQEATSESTGSNGRAASASPKGTIAADPRRNY
jgi:L-ascorbate metabolism protein UlaG (beta-lactamase superfamily)